MWPPIHVLACFGRKFERTVFERMTSSHLTHTPDFIFTCYFKIQFLKFNIKSGLENFLIEFSFLWMNQKKFPRSISNTVDITNLNFFGIIWHILFLNIFQAIFQNDLDLKSWNCDNCWALQSKVDVNTKKVSLFNKVRPLCK